MSIEANPFGVTDRGVSASPVHFFVVGQSYIIIVAESAQRAVRDDRHHRDDPGQRHERNGAHSPLGGGGPPNAHLTAL